MNGLFCYPHKAKFDQIIPKGKIYEHAKLKRAQKSQFIEFIKQIRWVYKLAPETINVSAFEDVKEIQIIRIELTQRDLPDEVLRLIDNAIPSVVIFELVYDGQIRVKVAYKQRKNAHSADTFLSSYFASDWVAEDISRPALPPALNLGILYDKILSELIGPDANIDDEASLSLADRVKHQEAINAKQVEIVKIERKLKRTKQFNKRLETNSILKKAKSDLARLKKPFKKRKRR